MINEDAALFFKQTKLYEATGASAEEVCVSLGYNAAAIVAGCGGKIDKLGDFR